MDCIIVGPGPSLKYASRAWLDSMPSYGCNQIGLYYQPTYFVAIDNRAMNLPTVLETARAAKRVFLRNYYPGEEHNRALYRLPNVELMTRKDYVFPGEKSHSGSTATYVMLKLAYFHGFDTVYLIGIDHTAEHISPEYQTLTQPSFEARERHYKIAADVYKKAGRRVVNLSAYSVLDRIFDSHLPTNLRELYAKKGVISSAPGLPPVAPPG